MSAEEKPPTAEQRARRHKSETRWFSACALVLLAWLAIGFVREPPAPWWERLVVVILILVPVALWAGGRLERRTLPALDRTPREATVTGYTEFEASGAEDTIVSYVLYTVTLRIDGGVVESHIADVIADESAERFAVGSTWGVYAFHDPHAFSDHGPGHARVILTEGHDDVLREGYDLIRFALIGARPGPGSDVLMRRFADDS